MNINSDAQQGNGADACGAAHFLTLGSRIDHTQDKTMNENSSKIIGEQMRIVVNNQLESGELPFVNKTFSRLVGTGLDNDDVIRMMAHCMALIMFDIIKGDAEWDPERYQRMLDKLPDEEAIYHA